MKTFSFTKEFRPIEEAEFLERITKKVISEK
jgi:hypothetical protein